MKLTEIIELAMEALILQKLAPVATKEEIAEIDRKLKILGKMFAEEMFKDN